MGVTRMSIEKQKPKTGDFLRWTPSSRDPGMFVEGEVVDALGGSRVMMRVASVHGWIDFPGHAFEWNRPVIGRCIDTTFCPGRICIVRTGDNHDPGDEDRSER